MSIFVAEGLGRGLIALAAFKAFCLVSLTNLHCRFVGLAAAVEGASLYNGGNSTPKKIKEEICPDPVPPTTFP
jgi:hypothetical protein